MTNFSLITLLALASMGVAAPKPQAGMWTGGSIDVAPPPAPGDGICDAVITDDCGGDGQPACCYEKYTPGSSCLNGGLVHIGDNIGKICDSLQDSQRKNGCSCPKDCTTGDMDGKGTCV